MILHLDFESKSSVDLPKRGSYVYANGKDTKVILAGYAVDNEPVRVWDATADRMPWDLNQYLRDPEVRIVAFNAQFERLMVQRVLRMPVPTGRFFCVQAMANACSFTGGLDQILDQAGLPAHKQADGKALIKLFCIEQADPLEHPVKWARFIAYCMQDVVVSRKLFRYLRRLYADVNWDDYHLDQMINDAGVPVDRGLAARAIALSAKAKDELMVSLKSRTGLANPNSGKQFKEFLWEWGIKVPNLQKQTMIELRDKLLEKGDTTIASIVGDRLLMSRSSLAKWEAIRRAQIKGVMRGMFQFLGAARTGRWAGRLVQLQNLPRPTIPNPAQSAELLLELGDDDFTMLHPDVLGALSSMIRSAIRAPKGKRLVVADLGSIEGRIGGWLTDCKAVRGIFDRGDDQYMEFAKHIFSTDHPTRKQRNIAKPAVLGCQYRLGPKGLQIYAKGMGVIMTRKEARNHVNTFRHLFWEIPEFWETFEDELLNVIRRGGEAQLYRCRIIWNKGFLCIMLPSGRPLFYNKPEVQLLKIKYEDDDGVVQTFEKNCFTFMGMRNNFWCRISAHGGHILENIVQALARDVLMEGIRRACAYGLDVRLHCHDEIGILSDEGDAANLELDALVGAMTEPMKWAPDMPLAADGYIAERYRK